MTTRKPKTKPRHTRILSLIWKGVPVFYKCLAIFATLLGFIFLPPIYNLWHSKHERYEDVNYLTTDFGIKTELAIGDELTVKIGSKLTNSGSSGIGSPYNIVNNLPMKICGFVNGTTDTLYHFNIKLIDQKVYVSSEFRDINNEYIGEVNYATCKFLNRKIVNYFSNDSVFEVYDNYNNVVFSISYGIKKTIDIAGYFVTNRYIMVAQKHGNVTIYDRLDKSNFQLALADIKKISHASQINL